MKPVIRLGDPTSHGGEVVSAAATTKLFGKPVACLGDSVSCPKPGHDNCVIVEGDDGWKVDGRPVALDGHRTSCGAVLIATLGEVMRDPVGGSASSVVLPAMPTLPAVKDDADDNQDLEYFFVAEREDGSPIHLAYRIDAGGSNLHEGTLNQSGETVALPMSQTGEPTFWIPLS